MFERLAVTVTFPYILRSIPDQDQTVVVVVAAADGVERFLERPSTNSQDQ
jgi:hypothetical protein